MKFPTWINSVRAVLAVEAMCIVALIVIGDMFGKTLSSPVLALVGSSVVGVIMAYYSKGREPDEKNTTSTTETTTTSTSEPKY